MSLTVVEQISLQTSSACKISHAIYHRATQRNETSVQKPSKNAYLQKFLSCLLKQGHHPLNFGQHLSQTEKSHLSWGPTSQAP